MNNEISSKSEFDNESVLQFAIFSYEKEISEEIEKNYKKFKYKVIDENKLKEIHNAIKNKIREDKDKIENYPQLKEKILNVYKQICINNENNFKRELSEFLKENETNFQLKIKNRIIISFVDLVKKVEAFLNLDFMNYVNVFECERFKMLQEILINDFRAKIFCFASAFFEKVSKEEKKKLENQVSQIKTAYESLDKQKIEVENEMEKTLRKKDTECQILTDNYDKVIQKLKEKIAKSENDRNDSSKTLKIKIIELEKEKKGLEIENKNLLTKLDEISRTKNINEKDIEVQIKERIDAFNKEKNAYENQIKTLKDEIENLTTKSIELESSIKTYEQQIEFEKLNSSELIEKIKLEKEKNKKEVAELKGLINDEKNKLLSQLESKETIIQKLIQKSKESDSENMKNFKESEEKIIQKAKKFENDYFAEKQKNSFLEEKNKDLLEQLEQAKANQDKIVEYFRKQKDEQEDNIDKFKGLEQVFNKEKELLENNLDKQKESYIKETEKKLKSISFLENEVKNCEMKYNSLKKDYDKIIEKNKELEKEIKKTEDIRNHFNGELARQVELTKENFEKMMFQKEQEHQNSMRELNESSEKTIKQIKNIFEEEKKRFEEKLAKMKEQNGKLINETAIEYEEKMREINDNLKNDLDNLHIAHEDLKAKYNTLTVESEHNIKVLSQKILTSDRILAENKKSFIALAKVHNEDIQEKLIQFEKERKAFNDKIEAVQNENNRNIQIINGLNLQIEKLEGVVKNKDVDILNQKEEYEATIEALLKKFDLYKQKQQEIANEFSLKKKDFERESSLLKQQIDFLNKKVENQLLYNEEKEMQNDENVFELTTKMEETFNTKLQELVQDKKDLASIIQERETKIEKIENNFKDFKQKNEDIIINLTNQGKSLQKKIDSLVKQIEKQNNKINNLLKVQASLEEENMQLNTQILVLEQEKTEDKKEIEELHTNNDLLTKKNDDLNLNVTQLRKHLKLKAKNNEIEKRHNSLTIKRTKTYNRSSSNDQIHKMSKSDLSNVSMGDSFIFGTISNGSFVKKNILHKKNTGSLWKTEKKTSKK